MALYRISRFLGHSIGEYIGGRTWSRIIPFIRDVYCSNLSKAKRGAEEAQTQIAEVTKRQHHTLASTLLIISKPQAHQCEATYLIPVHALDLLDLIIQQLVLIEQADPGKGTLQLKSLVLEQHKVGTDGLTRTRRLRARNLEQEIIDDLAVLSPAIPGG